MESGKGWSLVGGRSLIRGWCLAGEEPDGVASDQGEESDKGVESDPGGV